MDVRHFVNPKDKPVFAPRVDHVAWTKELIQKQSVEGAYRIIRPLAVPRFVNRKESIDNHQFGFYMSALKWLKKNHPYQSKHGGKSA